MKSQTLKMVGGALSAVALVSGGATVAVAAPASAPEAPAAPAAVESVEAAAVAGSVKAPVVEGTFSFDQATVSSTESLTGMFAKAAATLCNALPVYQAEAAQTAIEVSRSGEQAFAATVGDMADTEGATGYVMACSCATNGPGGGAIANADVEGVSLESVLALAAATAQAA